MAHSFILMLEAKLRPNLNRAFVPIYHGANVIFRMLIIEFVDESYRPWFFSDPDSSHCSLTHNSRWCVVSFFLLSVSK